jgi:hypothetical protein
MIELGRMVFVCSTYDSTHRTRAAASASRAAGSDARVRSGDLETSTMLTICRMPKMARRI